MIQVALVLIVGIYLWWAIQVLVPLTAEARKVIAIIVLIFAILMLLWAFGAIPLFHVTR